VAIGSRRRREDDDSADDSSITVALINTERVGSVKTGKTRYLEGRYDCYLPERRPVAKYVVDAGWG
jgi:hypothetical protein